MKKKIWIPAIALLAAAGVGCGLYWNSHFRVEGHFYPKNAQVLDVRNDGLTAEGYRELSRKLPNTQILWELPFQGGSLPLDTSELTLSSLTAAEAEQLDALTMLETVDGAACSDVDSLMELARRHPKCRVLWQVGGWSNEAESIEAANPTVSQLREDLKRLPNVRTVSLTGSLPKTEELDALAGEFPEIQFLWNMTIGGKTIAPTDTQLVLNDIPVDRQSLEAVLSRMPALEKAELLNCRISQQDMLALVKQYPQVAFLWEMDFFGQTVRTDAEEIDISETPIEDVTQVEELAACFPNLKKVVMCGCGVENETMDALNRRHADVQYVWDVQICWRKLRTDITWFFPFRQNVEPNGDDLYNLRYCTEVECVDIGHALVKDIEWAAFMPKLKYMIIGDTMISDITPLADHKELIFLEMFKTQVTDYTPLLSCTALEDLNLGYTYGDPAIIAQMTWLRNLWWHRPCPPWGGPESDIRLNLGTTLPNATVDVSYTEGSTDGGWRELPNYYAQRDFLGMFYMEG